MMRILGIVCGAAIAVALLTWFVGVPQFTSQRSADNGDLFSVVALPDPEVVAAEPPAEELPPAVHATSVADASTTPDVAEAETVLPDMAERADAAVPEGAADGSVTAQPELDAAIEPVRPAESPDLPDQWYAFWSPFRSEIAANGFVAELQRVTGLDYRVVKVKPGVYEVAFAYGDDESLEQYLSTISAATGLDLPGRP